MKILCLDTSAGSAVALVDDAGGSPEVVARAVGEGTRRHAETLSTMVQEVLAAGSPAAVDLVAVGTGPAPFTGLRVGLVTAAALGRGWGADVVGISSLDVLARQALDRLGPGEEVLVATDARRKEVYWARYRAAGPDDVERLAGPAVEPAAAVGAGGGLAGAAVAGAGARLYPQDLPATDGLPDQLDAAVLARLARSRLARRAAGADVELGTDPLYLRRPDVHVAGAPKRVS